MFKNVINYFNKRRLKNKKYLYLFDKPCKDEYVCLDCETTGLDPKKDDIVSIAAIIIKNNEILSSKKFVKFAKPKTKLQAKAIKIHHIRECDLKDAEEIENVIKEFLEFIGNRILVGYYLEFDIKMINKYLKNFLGITLPNKTLEVSAIYYDWKQKAIPQGHIDLRFNTILKDLELPNFGKHNAYNDVIMTSMMFLKLKNQTKSKIKHYFL